MPDSEKDIVLVRRQRMQNETNGTSAAHEQQADPADGPAAILRELQRIRQLIEAQAVELVGADVAGPMCGRSEASWWRDHAAGRVPAPVNLGGSTLWRV